MSYDLIYLVTDRLILGKGFTLLDIPYYSVGGAYWKVLSFGTAVGGSILAIGSISGIVMMQMQNVSLKWYFRHITPLTFMSGILAFVVLCIIA